MNIHKAAHNTLTLWKSKMQPAAEWLFHNPKQDPYGRSTAHMSWMLDQIIHHEDWENDKLNRWLGYVQAFLVIRGYVTLAEIKRCNKEA